MPAFNDDDFNTSDDPPPGGPANSPARGRRRDGWNVDDDAIDDHHLVPDEMTTVRCTNCKKFIFEDSVRCPYCKSLQLELRENRQPFWFLAMILFFGCLLGCMAALYLFGFWPRR